MRSKNGKLIGHLTSHNPFITNITEGRINGRKGTGRPRKTFVGEMTGMVNGYTKTLALKSESPFFRYDRD